LNEFIADKVMGWIAWEEKRGEYTYIVFQKPGEREPYKKTQRWEEVMHRYRRIGFDEINHQIHIVTGIKEWSTDISAAWEVVETLQVSHIYTDIRTCADFYEVWITAPPFREEIQKTETVASPKLPEAICKAALLAVLEEVPNDQT